jgi:hypothetical protein
LIWAGLNLTAADLSAQGCRQGGGTHYYPLRLVRALSVVWLFAGLRWNEIRRLRLGCIRWQESAPGERVCLLSIPVNKTGTAFTKPVDTIVDEMIETWERERPAQTKIIDPIMWIAQRRINEIHAFRSTAYGCFLVPIARRGRLARLFLPNELALTKTPCAGFSFGCTPNPISDPFGQPRISQLRFYSSIREPSDFGLCEVPGAEILLP